MDSGKEPSKRLPYEKPKLRIISLVAEEVLAVNCKVAQGSPGRGIKGCGNASCKNPGGS